MNLSDLRPVGQLAHNYGVKSIVYGSPGSGKSPIALTSPRPIMLITEPGTMSMKGSNVPAYEAFTTDRVEEFFTWWFSNSKEVGNFDTLIIDSISQMCDIYLQNIEAGKSKSGNKVHGKAAYGAMAKEIMTHARPLFFMKSKHIYLIAKESNFDGAKRPYFPGQQLHIDLPHMYDLILHLGIHNIPGMGQLLSFQCRQTIDILARDRSGRLNEYEPPDFGALVRKVMI